jgi:hypothetical protein
VYKKNKTLEQVMENTQIIWILIMIASYFAESLLVSAESLNRLDVMRTVPYLRARCVGFVKSNSAIPTICPPRRAGSFHVNGCPFEAKKNKNGDRLDLVKRFKISHAATRDADVSSSMRIISEPALVVPNETIPSQVHTMDLRPWDLQYATLIEMVGDSYFEVGQNCSERTYQLALVQKLYKQNVPCLMEKNIYMTEHGNPILKGRIDIEIASKYILELKVTPASVSNIRKDKKQLRRYISAYHSSGIYLERAALIYYGSNQVRIIEVDVHDDDRFIDV